MKLAFTCVGASAGGDEEERREQEQLPGGRHGLHPASSGAPRAPLCSCRARARPRPPPVRFDGDVMGQLCVCDPVRTHPRPVVLELSESARALKDRSDVLQRLSKVTSAGHV